MMITYFSLLGYVQLVRSWRSLLAHPIKFILTGNNIIITIEYATGYVTPKWDDRMHILIIISSCGTLLGQSLTKTAFAVTLLKLTKGFSYYKICHCILWYCIVSMCSYNLIKVCRRQHPQVKDRY